MSVRDDWGSLSVEAGVLMVRTKNGIDRFQVAAPSAVEAKLVSGDGWELKLAEGWEVVPGPRKGDYVVVKAK
jgi:hypothetical protein